MIRYAEESVIDYNIFYSGDYGTESKRPALIITYSGSSTPTPTKTPTPKPTSIPSPSITVMKPSNNQEFTIGNTSTSILVPVSAVASNCVKMEFYWNGNLVSTSSSNSITYDFYTSQVGYHTLVIRAYSSNGNYVLSSRTVKIIRQKHAQKSQNLFLTNFFGDPGDPIPGVSIVGVTCKSDLYDKYSKNSAGAFETLGSSQFFASFNIYPQFDISVFIGNELKYYNLGGTELFRVSPLADLTGVPAIISGDIDDYVYKGGGYATNQTLPAYSTFYGSVYLENDFMLHGFETRLDYSY
jgi:hypothetical protein